MNLLRKTTMISAPWIRAWLASLIGSTLMATTAIANVTNDRLYRMGDDGAEGAANNGAVTTTFDSAGLPDMGQLIDLTAVNAPTYRTVTGRPDGGTGLGIEFNAAQSEYLHGPNLGDPSVSASSLEGGGTLDYDDIFNRGFQFWVKPSSTAVQSLVMDTNQHGVRINGSGRFSMRYAGTDYDSTLQATVGTWYHVMVARPSGAAGGSRLYVNGVAVAAAAGGYDDDTSDLVVGSNTGGEAGNFTGGTSEFFSGVIDDLEMFVLGSNATANYGTFNFFTDNKFADFTLTSVVGDIAGNDGVINQTDKNAFIAGWLDRRLVNNVQVGDLTSYAQGDLNFDGITDITDLARFQQALTGAGVAAITPAELAAGAVPEPSTAALLAVALLGGQTIRRRLR
jgi:hypothetical protein